MNRIDEITNKYLPEANDGMTLMAKEMGSKTAINPSAIMRYFKLKNLDLMSANDIMAKYSKSKKWIELSRDILSTKGVL